MREGIRRRGVVLGLAFCAIALGAGCPAQAWAGQTVGTVGPSASNQSCGTIATIYPFTAGPDSYMTQTPGVIVSWAFANKEAVSKFELKVGHSDGVNTIKTVAQSAPADLAAGSDTPHPVRIPVSAGDRIGFYSFEMAGSFTCGSPGGGADGEQVAVSDQAPGDSTTYSSSTGLTIPLSARVEPDADGDGFGDETQDGCPSNPTVQGACPAVPAAPSSTADKTKPALGALNFSSTVFRAANFGASTAKKKAPVGTKVSFSLSEASSVKFTVQRKTKGRKVGHKCKTKTHSNRKKKACTLYKSVKGSFTIKGKAGKNTFTFTGRVGGKSLRPGSYRLNGTATDPSKNASVPKRKGFTIVK
jgi:hypothetical protein